MKAFKIGMPIFLAVALIGLANFALREWLIMPSYIELEEQRAKEDLDRIYDAIDREIEHVGVLASDWGIWDDTYLFVTDRNQDYIDANLVWSALEGNTRINLLCFFDAQGQLVWGKVRDSVQGGELITFSAEAGVERALQFFLQNTSEGQSNSGLVNTKYGLMLMASQAILTTEGKGPSAGVLLMGRAISPEYIARISEQTHVDFSLAALSSLAEERIAAISIVPESEYMLVVKGILNDVAGRPTAEIHAQLPREMYRQGLASAKLIGIMASVAMLALFLVMLLIYFILSIKLKTSQKTTSELVGRATKDLEREKEKSERARIEAQKASESKSIFMANMSHEIRTPMNAIINLTQFCLDTELDAKQKNFLEKVRGSANHLLHIINEILDLSKLEAGKVSLELKTFSLDQLFSLLDVRDSLITDGRDIQLVYDVHPSTPNLVNGDLFRIHQIMLNILANAFKFTERGRVSVYVTPLNITDDHCELEFSITDTGIGMSQDVAEKMFDMYSQEGDSTTRRYGGTGLGLAICRQLCMLMGGHIDISSEENVGTCVRVVLPLSLQVDAVDQNRTDDKLCWAFLQRHEKVEELDNFAEMYGVTTHIIRSRLIPRDIAEIPHGIFLSEWFSKKEIQGLIRLIKDSPLRDVALLVFSTDGKYKTLSDVSGVQVLTHPFYMSKIDAAARNHYQLHTENLRGPKTKTLYSLDKLAGLNLLLCDDNEINCEIVVGILDRANMNIHIVHNGLEAIEALNTADFDIVIMDVQMPVMDGWHATKRIRQQERWKALPIIGLSANAMREEAEYGLSIGMTKYLTKPISPQELHEALLDIVEKFQLQAGPIKKRVISHPVDTLMSGSSKTTVEPVTLLRSTDEEYVNFTSGLAICDGNTILQKRLLSKFLEKYIDLNDLETSASNGDDIAAVAACHELVGVASSIGAFALSERARQLEKDLRVHAEEIKSKNIQTKLDDLKCYLERSRGEIEVFLRGCM